MHPVCQPCQHRHAGSLERVKRRTARSCPVRGKMISMLILGIVLIVIGLLVPSLHILFTIGIILAIIGLVLLLLGTARTGGRRWY